LQLKAISATSVVEADNDSIHVRKVMYKQH